jgi:hypothetical protein
VITIDNLEEMAMPVTISIKEENGHSSIVKLPAEIWQKGNQWSFPYKSTSKIVMAIIDPDHVLPDINPDNNVYSGMPIPDGTTGADVIKNYLKAIGGEAKLKWIKELKLTDTAVMDGATVIRSNIYKAPGTFHETVTLPIYDNAVLSHIAVTADSVVIVDKGTNIKLSSTDKLTIRQKHKLFPELDYLKPGYTLQLAPTMQIINDTLVYLVTITTPDSIKIKTWYNQKTGYKMREAIDGATPVDYTDYREVNGIEVPYTKKAPYMGEATEFKVKSVWIN